MQVINNDLISNFTKLSESIENGDWKEHENQLSEKVNALIADKNKFSSYKSKRGEEHAPLPIAVFNLIGSLHGLGHQKGKITDDIEHLSSILFGKDRLLNSDALKYLSSEAEDLDKAVHTFKMLLGQKTPEAAKIFAEWIEYNGIGISKLRLSKNDLLHLAPHMKTLNFDSDQFNETDVHEIIANCKNLKTLVLATDSIKTTPPFPDGLKELTLRFNKNLENIPSLNEKLEKFRCESNENLKIFPTFLPNSLTEFTCIDNATVRGLPNLNEGLTYLDCSNSQIDELPELPKSLKELNIQWCERLKLPKNLNKHLKVIS